MAKNRKNAKDHSEDQSMGILNMDDLKVFGECSQDSNVSGNSRISGRLNLERMKALETLEKGQKMNTFRKPTDITNKENSNILNNSPKLNNTDYVPYCKPNTINITDLITDETINIETSSCPPSAAKDSATKVSFEPAEITARSTHYKKESVASRKQRGSIKDSARLSVSEILASSFAPKARNLCEALPPSDRLSNAVSSSSFNSYDYSRSLPRTADMSRNNSRGDSSFGAAINTNGFSSFDDVNIDDEMSGIDDFTPGEFMQSKLVADEISWAQQYAAIPTAALSEEAKAKVRSSIITTSTHFDSPSESNSMIAADPNFSVGNFFNMRSEKIWNIVQKKSPEKCRTPIALVDDDTVTTTTSKSSASDLATDISLTPKIDNKTYSKVELSSQSKNEKHESKDSGNSSDTSYLLSMSAIDRALCNLDIHTEDSEVGVINQIKLQAKKQKTNKNHYRDTCVREVVGTLSATPVAPNISTALKHQQIEELLTENKENVDPKASSKSANFSDTLSFTESLLNSSAMKTLDLSTKSNQARSPLSPIENIPIIKINDEENNDADIDEWPSTPIKLPHRTVRRSKSPKDGSTRSDYISISPEIGGSLNSPSQLPTKSLCSTRLDGGKNTSNKCDFGSSPKLSKSNTLVTNPSGNNSPSLCSSRSDSPASYDQSPISSPRSYMSSQASSPCGYQSPHLDTTSNSDRRLLTVAGTVRRTNSSPVYNELSSNSNFPVRNNSRNSVKSTGSAAGRSTSRCSNSSEFSHRDGKLIPLKVTCLEVSWASSRLRKEVSKSLQVKNISNKRLVVRVEVLGPGFQLVNSQGNVITLQSLECRSINIKFCATVTGIAVGSLAFYSPQGTTSSNKPFLEIPLNAYGGDAKILLRHVLKGPVGAPFLPMGDLRELPRPLEQTFKLYNKGALLGFASISLSSNDLNFPGICDAFEIKPERMLIAPGSSSTVRIVFRPRREDMKNIYKKNLSVLELAKMRIICGDEANRQRIQRLLARMSKEERSKFFENLGYLRKVWLEYKDEVEMSELEVFKENPGVVVDLLYMFRIYEISITLNHDRLDESDVNFSIACPDADETVLFRTVCETSPTPQQMLDPVDELLEGTLVANDECAVSSTREGSWSVRPNVIEFDFRAERRQNRVSLLIKNSYKSRQYFEVVCNCKDLLRFTPNEGYVQSCGGQIEVEVNTKHEHLPAEIRNREVMIMVYLENERITVPVKILDDDIV